MLMPLFTHSSVHSYSIAEHQREWIFKCINEPYFETVRKAMHDKFNLAGSMGLFKRPTNKTLTLLKEDTKVYKFK